MATNVIPEIPGYQISRLLGRGAFSVVYEGTRDGASYAIKVLNRLPSDVDQLEAQLRFRGETATIARLRHEGLVQVIEAGEAKGQRYLVMELAPGELLSARLTSGPMSEKPLLRMAGILAGALAEVHRHGFVHRDVKPDNIVVTETGDAKMLDFGLVTRVADEALKEDGAAVGTFAYAAPEQTGLLKRPVDGRADLYALGVVLFEAAAGRPPFRAASAAELMQLHATVVPPPPYEVNPKVGRGLSAVITKLLAKDPDDRYQSGEGLLADLRRVEERGAASTFELGTKDNVAGYAGSTPLVARHAELATLQAAWSAARAGRGAALLIEGVGGSGKTRLCRELIETATGEHALVLSGRCQALAQAPFGALREALDAHIAGLLRAPSRQRDEGLSRIREAAGDFKALLWRLSPGLEQLLGSAHAEVEADTERFYTAVIELLAELARKHTAALLIIEDVQWIDDSTRGLLARLADLVVSLPLVIIATGRSDDQDEAALGSFLEAMGQSLTTKIVLRPLSPAEVGELVAAHLGGHALELQFTEKLASLSNGNAFAIGEYVRTMVASGIVRPAKDTWLVDAARFESLNLTSDVLQLVSRRIAALSPETLQVLTLAAVAGSVCSRSLLADVLGDEVRVLRALAEAADANLVERGRDFTFVHKGVGEALLSRLPEHHARKLHQAVAEALARLDDDSAAHCYARARHFAAAEEEKSRRKVFDTNVAAGRRAQDLYAYEDAYAFLKTAAANQAVLSPTELPILAQLEEAIGRACRATSRNAEAVQHFEAALRIVSEPLGRARIYTRMSYVYMDNVQVDKAWDCCERALANLGRGYPRTVVGQVLSAGWAWLRACLPGRRKAARDDAGRAKARMMLEIYRVGGEARFFQSKSLAYVCLALEALYQARRAGACPEAAEAYSFLGAAMAHRQRPVAYGRYCNMGLAMAAELGDKAAIARAHYWMAMGAHMLGDLRQSELVWRRELPAMKRWLPPSTYAQAVNDLSSNLILRGRGHEALDLNQDSLKRCDRTKLGIPQVLVRAFRMAMLAMAGRIAEALRQYDETLIYAQRLIPPDYTHLARYHVPAYASPLLIEAEQLDETFEMIVEEYRRYRTPLARLTVYHRIFFVCQAYGRLRKYLKAPPEARDAAHAALLRALDELRRLPWLPATHCHYFLIRGVLAREAQRLGKARRLLDHSMQLAIRGDTPWGCFETCVERARLAAARGRSAASRREAMEAQVIARQNGWSTRRKRVETEFELETERSPTERSMSASVTINALALERQLDSLLKVSLASASTLEPSLQAKAALDEIVKVLAAERAFLFLRQAGVEELTLAAGRDTQHQDLTDRTDFSHTVIDRVSRTRVPVVVTGTTEGELVGSQSAVAFGLRSIMAAPVKLGDDLLGVVYVDSRLAKGVFTEADVGILLAIANHIGIAISTARAAQGEMQRLALEKDLALTAAVQSLVLPRIPSYADETLELCGYCRPATHCGGDWWWYESTDEAVTLLIADITGHGTGAAMVTATVAGLFQGIRRQRGSEELGTLLAILHEEFLRFFAGTYQMTLSAVSLTRSTGRAELFGAGSTPIFVATGSGVDVMPLAGRPLGSTSFAVDKGSVTLAPGHSLLLFSDGLPELLLPNGSELGLRRAAKLFSASAKTAGAAVDAIVRGADAARADVPLEDDLTVVVLRRRDVASVAATPR